MRAILSGGAPLSEATHEYLRSVLGVTLLQGYGLTESCACASIMDRGDLSTGSSGPPLQGVQIRLINWEEGGYRVTDKPHPRGEVILGESHFIQQNLTLMRASVEAVFLD